MLAGKTLDNWWKEMQMMYPHLCKKTQLYKSLELGHLCTGTPTCNTKLFSQPTMLFEKLSSGSAGSFVEMIPMDSRLNSGPYDLHTNRFTALQMLTNLIMAMEAVPCSSSWSRLELAAAQLRSRARRWTKTVFSFLWARRRKALCDCSWRMSQLL
jgi:hypothetical protein